MPLTFKQLRGGFFDPRKVLAAAARADDRLQAKFGAYVRRRMKSSIRYQRGTAPPGSPPYAHRATGFARTKVNRKTGAVTRQGQSPLRELIFFARDPATKSTVIGPVAFGPRGAAALERGGTATVTDRTTGRPKTVRVRPHPFAKPAGDAEAKNFPELIRASIH